MKSRIIGELERKYPFLNSIEIELLYYFSLYKINYESLANLTKDSLNVFLKKYSKKIEKNKDSNLKDDYNLETDNEKVNIVFLLKKKKMDLDKILKAFQKTDNKDIENLPDQNKIIKIIKLKNKAMSVCSFALIIISFGCVAYSLINIKDWQVENKKTEKISDFVEKKVTINESDLPKEEEVVSDDYFKYLNLSMMDVDLNKLIGENSETKGWIKVNGTNINYPFVQHEDNEYYLKHSFDKSQNKKGWVFMDYRNNIEEIGKNTILYAHGLVNNAMFGSLRKTTKPEWYKNEDNYIIKMSTNVKNLLWEVFSTYTIEPESYYITTDFSDDNEYNEFLNKLKDRSVFNYGVELNTNDKILTLSSCYNNQKRMVIHAKLIAATDK